MTNVEIHPMAGYIGAEIGGVNLTRLENDDVDAIRAALGRWKVVFFRDQSLDHKTHLEFARKFGDPTPSHVYGYIGPDAPPDDTPNYILTLNASKDYKSDDNKLHSDSTPLINPPAAGILRAEVVPPYGGDTQWFNISAAYEGLSPAMQSFADGLRASHVFPVRQATGGQYLDAVKTEPVRSIHPVVRVHPETGDRVLFVNPTFTESIVGLSSEESARVLDLFYEQIARPEYSVRFRWSPGSVAFWDNRATVHRVPMDVNHLGFDRIMHRITLVGDVPRGVDGEESESVSGAPLLAAKS